MYLAFLYSNHSYSIKTKTKHNNNKKLASRHHCCCYLFGWVFDSEYFVFVIYCYIFYDSHKNIWRVLRAWNKCINTYLFYMKSIYIHRNIIEIFCIFSMYIFIYGLSKMWRWFQNLLHLCGQWTFIFFFSSTVCVCVDRKSPECVLNSIVIYSYHI